MNRDAVQSAHSVRGIPPSEILTPYPSVRSLVNSQVRRYGDRTFLISYREDGSREKLSYRAFSRRVFQGANYLRDRQVRFGERVTPQNTQGVNLVLEIFAIWAVGCAAVIDPRTSRQRGDPKRYEEIIGDYGHEFQTGKKSRIDDDVLVVYPQADGGIGRGIRLTHYNLLVEGMAVARRLEISENSVVVCGLPIPDITAMAGCVMSTLYEGGTLVIAERPSGALLIHAAEKEKATIAFVDESFLEHARHKPEISRESLASLYHLITAVNGVTTEFLKEIWSRLRLPVITGLSVPESTSFASLVPLPGENESHLSWLEDQDGVPLGKALDPTEITVMDQQGNELAEKRSGEIVVRGHTVMKGYLEDGPATDEAFRAGWLHTNRRGFFREGPDGDPCFFASP